MGRGDRVDTNLDLPVRRTSSVAITPKERDAVLSVVEPQMVRSLGELGFVGSIDGDAVELAFPVLPWPNTEALTRAIVAVAH